MIPTNRSQGALRAAVILAAGLCGIPSLNALAQVPTEPPPQTATPVLPEAAPLQEEKLDQFADAYLVIEEIHTEAVAELNSTEDPAAAHHIKAKAEGKIIQAVERSGLKLDEFNQIAELAAVDDALRMKIADRVDKRRRI
ncbi:MAG: DUF4168 domain-containing protein [Steroidobacter sp.]